MAKSLEKVVVTVEKDGAQQEKFLLDMPNLRSLQGYLKGFWDLSIYNDCFPKKNRIADVDGSIEMNGHTLVIEFKESKWGMNQGQVIKAIQQAIHSNICTVFIIGKTNNPTEYLLFTPHNLQPDYTLTDVEGIKKLFTDWVAYAESESLVEKKSEVWNLSRKYFGKSK